MTPTALMVPLLMTTEVPSGLTRVKRPFTAPSSSEFGGSSAFISAAVRVWYGLNSLMAETARFH
jgi:hypothetical protein